MNMDQVRDELAYLDEHVNRVRPKMHTSPAMVQVYLSWIEKGVPRHVAIIHFENALFSGQPPISRQLLFWGLSALVLLVAPLIFALEEVITRGLFREGAAFYLVGVMVLVYGMLKSGSGEGGLSTLKPVFFSICLGVLLYFLYTEKILYQGTGPAFSPEEAVHRAVVFATFLYGLIPLGIQCIGLFYSAKEVDVMDSIRAIRKRLDKDDD